MHILVTGSDGFVGKHLVSSLISNNHKVTSVGGPNNQTVDASRIHIDLTDRESLSSLKNIEDIEAVIHLAGLAAVGPSFDNPQKYIEANSAMVTNICEHFLSSKFRKPRIILVSSGAIYDTHQTMPITESSGFGFSSPYAVSKILNENQAAYYRNRGLDVVTARPFNHIGPNQSLGFLIPDLLSQISKASTQKRSLKIGDLSTKRDYTDVRDVARAYMLLATSNNLTHHTYNVCSGKSIAGELILKKLMALLNAPSLAIEIDESKIRPNDPKDIYGDSSRLHIDTGWAPTYTLDQTLSDIIKAS